MSCDSLTGSHSTKEHANLVSGSLYKVYLTATLPVIKPHIHISILYLGDTILM